MFRTRCSPIAVWLVALLLQGMALAMPARGEPAADKGKEETKKLQGTWKVLAIERDEEKSDKSGDDIKLIFTANNLTAKTPNGDHKGTFKIDAAATPKTIDVMLTDGPDADKSVVGIYELKGNDLKICFAKPGEQDRPKEYVTKNGTGIMVLTLKRE